MTERRAWILFWILFATISISALSYDFRIHPKVAGDQASHLLQALSIAHQGDLKFDQSDLDLWRTVGWEGLPNGLFYQKYSGGFAFAKPYLYSLWLAPFVGILGPRFGVAFANWLIFVLVTGISVRILRFGFRGALVPLLASAFYCASYFYMYLFAIEPAIFHALLVATFCWLTFEQVRRPEPWRVFAAALLLAVSLAEKVSLGLLFGPIFIYLLIQPRAPRWKALGLFAASFFLLLLPYLHYSDWKSATPYGGDRYYCVNRVPFTETSEDQKLEAPHNTHKSLGLIAESLQNPKNLFLSTYYYFVGGYAGMLIFAPAVFIVLLAGTMLVLKEGASTAIPILLGILLCIAGYIILYPTNYYGGGQTVGNRWFVKMIPAILSLAVATRMSPGTVRFAAYFGMIFGGLFLYRQHWHHRDAFSNPAIVGEVQRLFPLETNQAMMPEFAGVRRVNICLYPHSAVWQCLPKKSSLPALRWTERGPEEYPVETIKAFHYVRFIGEPIYLPLQHEEKSAVYVGNGQLDPSQTFCSSVNRSLSFLVRTKDPVYLHVWSPVGKTTCTVNSGTASKPFETSQILKLTGAQNGWSRIDLTGTDEFSVLVDEPNLAEAREIPKQEVVLAPVSSDPALARK